MHGVLARADLAQLAALVDAGQLRVHVNDEIPLAKAAKAHELSSANSNTGEIVLTP